MCIDLTGTGLQDGLMFTEAGHRMPVGPFRRPPVLAISILRPFGRGPSGLPNGRTFLERNLPEFTVP